LARRGAAHSSATPRFSVMAGGLDVPWPTSGPSLWTLAPFTLAADALVLTVLSVAVVDNNHHNWGLDPFRSTAELALYQPLSLAPC
jgi:hypothetical protein